MDRKSLHIPGVGRLRFARPCISLRHVAVAVLMALSAEGWARTAAFHALPVDRTTH